MENFIEKVRINCFKITTADLATNTKHIILSHIKFVVTFVLFFYKEFMEITLAFIESKTWQWEIWYFPGGNFASVFALKTKCD